LYAKKKKPSKAQLRELSILKGRSLCPNCKHQLATKDLVPIFSWLALKGRCRYCNQPISWQYPTVELVTSIIFVLSYLYWPLTLSGIGRIQFIFWLLFIIFFVALVIFDLRWLLLPDRIVYPLIVVAVTQVIVVAIANKTIASGLWEPALAALVISGIFYVLFQISDGKWIGGGDVKLAVVLGLLAGTPLKALLIIFLASLSGTVISLVLMVKDRRNLNMRVPFGPFLLLATAIVVLFGTTMINWYTNRFI
jgi:prepilin signal peptidase PulO-like enzyme (type II secretory pathway)